MRKLHLSLLFLWLVPGAAASWVWHDSIAWVMFMSWYAILATHFSAWRADEPT